MGKTYKKISSFTSVITGGTPSTKIKEYWEDGKINWLSSGDLNQGIIKYSSKKITDLGYQKSVTKLMPIDTVAIALTGATTGVCGILEIEACGNQSVTGILPSKNHDSKYLFYYLRSLREKIMNDSFGGAQQHINQQYVKDILVPIISLDQQKQIAKTLDKAQELIDLRKSSIAKLDELAKSIFMDMFGDPVSNPKGWEVKKIAGLGKVQTGNTPPRAEADNYGNYLEWIKSDNILRDKISIIEAREYLSQKGAKKGRIAEKGSLLFTCIAGSMLSIGNLGYVDRTVAFNQQINSLTPINNNSLYLYFLFTLSKQVFEESSTKSMKIMVNKSTFEGLSFPIAPIEVQNKFAQIIEKIEEQKSLYEQELEKLEDNFQALLQQSFGE